MIDPSRQIWPQKACKPNQLTIGYDHYRPLKGQWLPRQVPVLKLGGQWLADAGFKVGSKAVVTIADGELVIRVVPPAEAPAPQQPCRTRMAGRASAP